MKYTYTPEGMQNWMDDHISDILRVFMETYGELIGDYDDLADLVDSCVEHWAVSSDYFYDE